MHWQGVPELACVEPIAVRFQVMRYRQHVSFRPLCSFTMPVGTNSAYAVALPD